jgi:hypothetical protein
MDFFSDSFSEDGRDRRKSYLNGNARVAQQQLSSGILAPWEQPGERYAIPTGGIWVRCEENPPHTSKVVETASH